MVPADSNLLVWCVVSGSVKERTISIAGVDEQERVVLCSPCGYATSQVKRDEERRKAGGESGSW